jgi:hypothetical protein
VLERIETAIAYGLSARARAAGIPARPAHGHGVRAARDCSRQSANSLMVAVHRSGTRKTTRPVRLTIANRSFPERRRLKDPLFSGAPGRERGQDSRVPGRTPSRARRALPRRPVLRAGIAPAEDPRLFSAHRDSRAPWSDRDGFPSERDSSQGSGAVPSDPPRTRLLPTPVRTPARPARFLGNAWAGGPVSRPMRPPPSLRSVYTLVTLDP